MKTEKTLSEMGDSEKISQPNGADFPVCWRREQIDEISTRVVQFGDAQTFNRRCQVLVMFEEIYFIQVAEMLTYRYMYLYKGGSRRDRVVCRL